MTRFEHEQSERSEVREVLDLGWEQLVASFDELLTARPQLAPHARDARFAELERQLRGYMCIEDELMLRSFELYEPREASALRAEHHELRRLLDELPRELEQTTHSWCAQSLLRLLRSHSKRKLMRLFPWVDSRLRQHTKSTILDRVRALTSGRRSMVDAINISELDEPLVSSWA